MTVEFDRGIDGPTLTLDKPGNITRPLETTAGGPPRARWMQGRLVQMVAIPTVLILAGSGYVVVDPLSAPGADTPAGHTGRMWPRPRPGPRGDLRPDNRHTSFVVGVLRLDPALIRRQLHPGTRDPGGNWHTPNVITASARNRLAMAFNGGFRLTDPSHPGY